MKETPIEKEYAKRSPIDEEELEGPEGHDAYNLDYNTINAVTPERENQLDQMPLQGEGQRKLPIVKK